MPWTVDCDISIRRRQRDGICLQGVSSSGTTKGLRGRREAPSATREVSFVQQILSDLSVPNRATRKDSNCPQWFCTTVFGTKTCRSQARFDPNFVSDERIPIQAYTNVLGNITGESIPSSSSFVGGSDGYHPSACLAVDADFGKTSSGRGAMATMLWRPFVTFHSGHYRYSLSGGVRSIVQVGVSADTTPHFGREQAVGEPAPDQSPGR